MDNLSIAENFAKLFFVSFIINFILTKFLIKNADRLSLIDNPNIRKVHNVAMPVVGGLAIVLTISAIGIYLLFNGTISIYLSNQEIISIIISTYILVTIGLMDDLFGLSPFNKFLFQLIAAIIFLVGVNIHFKSMFYIDFPYINFILNIFFIVGITNAFNLLDGLDGLAGGVSLIICFTMIILFSLSNLDFFQIAILVTMAGSLFSFMFYNKSPAKTFLGDTGSLFLGWYFAIISIYFAQKTSLSLSILLPFMIMGVPAFDVLFVMLSRFIKRHNYNITFSHRFKGVFYPDNTHLHHLFIRGGVSKIKAVFYLYSITFATCIICLLSWINRNQVNFIYGVIFILVLVFVVRSYLEFKIKNR